MCNNGGTEHAAGANCTVAFMYVKQVSVLCPPDEPGSGYSSGSGSGGNNNGSDSGFGNPYGGSGSDGGAVGNPPSDPQDIDLITSPVLNAQNSTDVRNMNLFYKNLTPAQKNWAFYNLNAYNQIIQYQIDNNWSDESELFVKKVLDLVIANNSNSNPKGGNGKYTMKTLPNKHLNISD
jgi:hypothetical protein